MKALTVSMILFFLTAFATDGFSKPRIIRGTVYTTDGKKAKGVIVTAERSRAKYYTSFDGTYEIKAKTNSKWLKFRFPDKEEKMNLKGIDRDVIDFRENGDKKSSPRILAPDKSR